MIAETPAPPYYAMIFTSIRAEKDNGYAKMAEQMFELAKNQPGFLGVESVRNGEFGITVSYWKDLDSIQKWKENAEHTHAIQRGKNEWYKSYRVRIAKVENDYAFEKR